jgi:hypothetical protein
MNTEGRLLCSPAVGIFHRTTYGFPSDLRRIDHSGMSAPKSAVAVDMQILDKYVGIYALPSGSVATFGK